MKYLPLLRITAFFTVIFVVLRLLGQTKTWWMVLLPLTMVIVGWPLVWLQQRTFQRRRQEGKTK